MTPGRSSRGSPARGPDRGSATAALGELAAARRYATGLPRYLRHPLSGADCRHRVLDERAEAPQRFIATISRGVFANPRSPYLPLLRWAGIAEPELVAMVRSDGVDAALERLYQDGVHVTVDEFKGRTPIVRPGLELSVRPEDFDNPLLASGFTGLTGGTSGTRRRLTVDLNGLAQEGAYYRLLLDSFGVTGARTALWRPVPPGVTGIKAVLRGAKAGCPVDRWFSPNRFGDAVDGVRGRSLVAVTMAAARLVGARVPWPEHVPPNRAEVVARWLADVIGRDGRAILHCTPSSAARVCDAAEAARLSIEGTFFRLGGEPFTAARRRRLTAAGAEAAPYYSITEVGNIGVACPERRVEDEVHLLEGKIAVLSRQRPLRSGETVNALFLTSLSTDTSKLMLNVESGDHASVSSRPCDCAMGRLGYERRLSGIRSYEKLTGDGMTFLASDLLPLLEEKLPERFGGSATDYQLVEEPGHATARISLCVSPSVGELSESELVSFVLGELRGHGRAERMMADLWGAGQTLSVVRREPQVTEAGKTPAFRTLPREPPSGHRSG